jgi:uncharacterized OB-fold protein
MSEAAFAKAPPDELFQLETDTWTEPYWNAAKSHKLMLPKCGDCEQYCELGASHCRHCLSQNINWIEHNGSGKVYSFTIIHFPVIPSLLDSVPYVPAVIELDGVDGIKLISNVVNVPLTDIEVDAAVSLLWYDRDDGISLPRFTLAK